MCFLLLFFVCFVVVLCSSVENYYYSNFGNRKMSELSAIHRCDITKKATHQKFCLLCWVFLCFVTCKYDVCVVFDFLGALFRVCLTNLFAHSSLAELPLWLLKWRRWSPSQMRQFAGDPPACQRVSASHWSPLPRTLLWGLCGEDRTVSKDLILCIYRGSLVI